MSKQKISSEEVFQLRKLNAKLSRENIILKKQKSQLSDRVKVLEESDRLHSIALKERDKVIEKLTLQLEELRKLPNIS